MARIIDDDGVTSPERLRQVVSERGGVPASDDDPEAAAGRTTLRREAAFVGLTFLGMVTGLSADLTGAPAALSWVGYGASYVFGGWYGLAGAIETLRRRAVDIDLLMITAERLLCIQQ